MIPAFKGPDITDRSITFVDTPDYDLDISTVGDVVYDQNGRPFTYIKVGDTFTTTDFTENADYAMGVLLSIPGRITAPMNLFELYDNAGSSRRTVSIQSNGIIYTETDSSASSAEIGRSGQKKFIPSTRHLYFIIASNTGNKSKLYISAENGFMFEVDTGFGGGAKNITSLRLYGGLNIYRVVGYNNFLYNPTNLVSDLNTKYLLNTEVAQNENLPSPTHAWHFSTNSTQFDIVGDINLTRQGTAGSVGDQFDNSDTAVTGTFYDFPTIPTEFQGDFTIVMRFQNPSSFSSTETLIDMNTIRVDINSSAQLQLTYNGTTQTISQALDLDAARAESGWYQIFLQRSGSTLSLFPEVDPGTTIESAPTTITQCRLFNNLAGTQLFNGARSWVAIANSRLSLDQKKAIIGLTGPNMGSVTTQGTAYWFIR